MGEVKSLLDSLNRWNLFLVLLVGSFARGQIQVGFLEIKNTQGQVLQLEEDFKYAHVAVRVRAQWLHAHPRRGVELVSSGELEKLGKLREIWLSDEAENLSQSQVLSYLGKPFDSVFSWDDDEIYCSELVAKLLGMEPSPMHFDLKYWPTWFQRYEGKPGISPGKIYLELRRRHYILAEGFLR